MLDRESAIETSKSFIAACNKNGLYFNKVLLFGSALKGNTHSGSDIDLLLVSDKFNDNPFENLKLYSKINILFPIIETHPISAANFFSNNSAFVNEIMKNAIELN
jgi:predicted nucleotidyltransferase